MTDGNPRPENESSDEARRELAAPFIPGAPRTSPESDEATPSPAPPPPEPGEPTGAEAAPAEPTEPADEPVEPEPAGAEAEAFPFETPWEEEEAGPEDDAEPESADEPFAGAGGQDEDEFPFEAFDIEGAYEEAAGTAEAEPEPAADTGGEPDAEAREMAAARDLADRLEEMARRLRDQGGAAVRQELESDDRFTALLAGLLGGYLAGRK